MKNLILILSLVLFIACTTQQEGTIECYNGCNIVLDEDESVIAYNACELSYWNAYVNSSIQIIPLYRRIRGKNHFLFIGIPLLNDSKLASVSCDSVQGMPCVVHRKDDNYHYSLWESDTMNVAQLMYEDISTRIFLMCTSSDMDTSMQYTNMKSRIKLIK